MFDRLSDPVIIKHSIVFLYILARVFQCVKSIFFPLVTSLQDLVAKVKNLVALALVLGAISRPDK